MPDHPQQITNNIRYASRIIKGSKQATILTGAGISTPSGIPDFRSTDSGLWAKYDPFEVASLLAFRHNPERFFSWMRPLVGQIQKALPNAAHRGLATLEHAGFIHTIITQNIDNLHQQAGSKEILEIHGSLQTLSCVNCFRKYAAGEYIQPYLEDGTIPHCPICGSILKPDVILMGEQLPADVWLASQAASRSCDLMIVAGSSLEVMPVASLPMLAVENGAHLIIINQTPTYIDVRADVVFNQDVAEIIPRIVNEVITEPIDDHNHHTA